MNVSETLLEEPVAVQHELNPKSTLRANVLKGKQAIARADQICDEAGSCEHPARDLRWLNVLKKGLTQTPYLIVLEDNEKVTGSLPLAFVSSFLFGRYLIGLPYLNSGGVDECELEIARALVDRAAQLADSLDCRFLELRHEQPVSHPKFNAELTQKVHMRLSLPDSEEALWDQLKSKVRSQVRKGLSFEFETVWGGEELLDDFYKLFCIRMHQLGTPVYGRRLFRSILKTFGNDAEICCLREGNRTIASALLVHGKSITEVPSASSLMEYNSSNANMVLYWHLQLRAIERGNRVFDFGRATRKSGPHRFKKQWGAEESPTCWQYYVRQGSADELRPDNAKNQKRIEQWKKLPLWVTRLCGPKIVRGIP